MILPSRSLFGIFLLLLGLALIHCSNNDDDDAPPPPANDDDVVDDDDAPLPLAHLVLKPLDGGKIDLTDSNGRLFLRNGRAEVLVEIGGTEKSFRTDEEKCVGKWTSMSSIPHASDYFAGLRGWSYQCEIDGVEVTWRVYTDITHDTVIAMVDVTNQSEAEFQLLRLTPLITDGPNGGLFIGKDPTRHRILDNGYNIALDVEANLHYVDEERNILLDGLFPISSRGDVVSNWNHAIYDLDSGASWVAGSLGVQRSFPTFGTTYKAETAPTLPDGRVGQNAFIADFQLAFVGKPISPGDRVGSEPAYFDPLAPNPFTGLEDYADAVAEWLEFTIWTKRDGGRPVPNGWNSWTGSGGTGGLGTNIDQTIMEESLDVMGREFQPYGIDYFQIDDGYQIADGDWFTRDDRFPDGMPALAEKIKSKGLIPGIWISAFTVSDGSTLFAEHPDWLADPEDSVVGGILSPGENARVLDLSNDEAIDWLGETLQRYKDEWHMGWIKLDFAYIAFTFKPRANPRLTSVEAYKRGIMKFREVLGDDVFYMGIALMGVNYGVVDAMRLTLDDGPKWEQDDPFALLGDGNNYKSTVKTGSRRYYLHNRVWLNHNDLLFFRTDTGNPDPVVTMEESITLASFFGLTGSIIKFGEDLRTLTPDQINVWRKLLPIYPATARPMDLFTLHYPEIYRLPIEGTLAGSDAEWMVVGLLNWGRNYDFDTQPPTEMADEARTYTIDLEEWGLDPEVSYLAREFWSGEYLGEVSGELTQTVAAHGHKVIALRPNTQRPQFLGHNRHFTQGATDLISESWDADALQLELSFLIDAGSDDAAPFEYRFDIRVPDGYALVGAEESEFEVEQEGEVMTLRYLPAISGQLTLALDFERE